jgi:C-terminal processing protease CtpA/Prc
MKRLVLLFATLALAAVGVIAQQTTEKKEPAKARAMVFSGMGDGGYLGVETENVNRENFGKFGLREARGVAIAKVIDGSPAALAGLQSGDVIVRVDDESIKSSLKLSRVIGEISPDQQARITYLRNGDERETTVRIGKRPAMNLGAFGEFPRVPSIQGGAPIAPQAPETKKFEELRQNFSRIEPGNYIWGFSSNRRLGVGVATLSKQLGEYFGVPEGKGLLVTEVLENSAAAKAGLRAGDVIVDVDGKEVNTSLGLIRAVGAKKEGEVTLTIVRDKQSQSVRVTPDVIDPTKLRMAEPPSIDSDVSAAPVAPQSVPAAPAQPKETQMLLRYWRII